jgi:hypothetical protein
MKFVGEIIEIREAEKLEEKIDEYGLIWRKYIRKIRLIGYRKNSELIKELPKNLMGKIIDQQVWLCVDPSYEWHFKKCHITLSKEEVEK